MTRASAVSRVDHTGTDATDTYSYSFPINLSSHLLVTEEVIATGVTTTYVETTDYTVSGAGDSGGGSITLTAGNLASTKKITIRRKVPITQGTDVRNQGQFYRAALEDEYDYRNDVDQQQQDEIDRSLKFDETVDPTAVDTKIAGPLTASYMVRVNATADGLELANLVSGSNITLPAGLAFMAQTAAGTFTARTFTVGAGLTMTNGDGQSGNPLIELPLTPREQDTPDDTVYVTAGTITHQTDETAAAVATAADAASGVTFPVVTANSRIDLLVVNNAGTFSRVAGSQAASPTPPAYPTDKTVICEVTVDETGTVVVNDADIKDVRPFLVGGNIRATTLASTSNGDGAFLIGVEDSAGNFTGTDVEAVLAELVDTSNTINVQQISVTRAAATASGTQAVSHSLGVKPTRFQCTANNPTGLQTSSVGFCDTDGTTFAQTCQSDDDSGVGGQHIEKDFIGQLMTGSEANGQRAAISAVTTTDFTITWTKVGTPAAGTYEFEFVVSN